MSKMVIGVFNERDDAESAITDLKNKDYNPKDLSIVMKDRSEAKEMAEDTGAGEVVSDTASGASTGAVLGGLAGLAASFLIPGLGAFFIGGPIAAALGLTGAAATTASGAATGALAGGFIGALTNLGVSGEDAKIYEKSIEEGGILLAIPARSGEEMEVKAILEENAADQIRTVGMETSSRSRDMGRHEDYSAMAGAKGGNVKEDIEVKD